MKSNLVSQISLFVSFRILAAAGCNSSPSAPRSLKSATTVTVHEGLPHQFREPDRLEQEKQRPDIVTIGGFHFYTASVAAIATSYLILTGIENWRPSFFAAALVLSVIFVVMVGPYPAFGALALSIRSNRVLSAILLAIILSVSMSAVIALAIENDAWLNRDRSREGQRMVPFLIGIAQWSSAGLAAAILFPLFIFL